MDLVFPPPYQDLPEIINGTGTGISDGKDGYAHLQNIHGNGGSSSGSAGVVGFYLPVSGLPLGHCRPYIQTYHDFHDYAFGACVHSSGTLSVTVVDVAAFFFGQIATAGIYTWSRPLWQDSQCGTGSYDAQNPHFAYAGFIEVPFPLVLGNMYFIVVEIGATADDSGLGGAWADVQLQVPFIEVGNQRVMLPKSGY